MSREELAWAGGIFEGEGCFTGQLSPRDGCGKAVCAVLRMTDEDTVQRFASALSFGKFSGPHNYKGSRASHKPYWEWRVGSFEHFQATAAMLWPWLGKRRKARIKELLATYHARVPRPLGPKEGGTGVTSPRRERNAAVRAMVAQKVSQAVVAERFGISKARVSAIVNFNRR